MYLFNIFEVDVFPTFITFFIVVLVVYLVILELEFRQVRSATKKFDEEKVLLGREMRELRKEIGELKDAIRMTK